MVYVFLADGFEIIEALAPVDVLKRAGIEVKTVGVNGSVIISSCGVQVACDMEIGDFDFYNVEAIVLPGGMPGTLNLENHETVQKAIDNAMNINVPVCAICAAPSILGHKGLLDGKSTSYTSKGKKTIVRPEIVENPYNGKVYFQWKTERGNKND